MKEILDEFKVEEEIKEIKKIFKEKGLEASAAVTKFSTRNPSHEIMIKEEFQDEYPNITLGHSMSGKLNFPRRVRTSYLNAAVHSIFNDFANNIESALKEVENVSKVSVDLENKSALVEGDNLEDDKLREAVEEIGFDVKEIK